MQRGWLQALLWPESLESRAAASLRQSLADLRRVLGSEARLLRSPGAHTVCFCPPAGASDLIDFDDAVARGAPASLAVAVSLYRGALLEGCVEEWIWQERQAREHAYLGALESLAAHLTGAGDHHAAVRHLRLLVTADPLRESAHRSLMEALAAG